MSQKTKKKRQQRAQSRLALARYRQKPREQRQHTAAHRAEKQWNKTMRELADLGATLDQQEVDVDGRERTVYEVTFEGKNHHFGTRFRLQRRLKRERQRKVEKQMSWAERHVQWMIEHNCDDHGNPWEDVKARSRSNRASLWLNGKGRYHGQAVIVRVRRPGVISVSRPDAPASR